MRRHRKAGRLVVAAGALALAGCTAPVSGHAVAASAPGNDAVPGAVLRQQPGSGPAKTFGGVPIFDACTVLPFDVVRASGIELETSTGPGPLMRTTRMTADGQDDPGSHGAISDAGATKCEYPGSQGELLDFTIYQEPFDSPNGREGQEKSLRGGTERQVAGFRTLSIANTYLHTWTTGIFADGFTAIVHLNARDAPQAENPRLTRLVENVAERLHSPPTGPATYAYQGEFADVPPPCEIFTSADFQKALGFGTDGRTTEEYDIGKKEITPDPMSGTVGQEKHVYVGTACTQENQSAANSEVGSTPAQSMTVTLENFLTPEMAAEANDYDCATGKGYRHPVGEPKPVPFRVGDGLTCLINMGSGHQSPMAFKAGRSTVELSAFYARNLKDDATAIPVFTSIANAVTARLTGR